MQVAVAWCVPRRYRDDGVGSSAEYASWDALKGDDLIAVEACAACHDAIDGRFNYGWLPGEKEEVLYFALIRQLHQWVVRGLISVKGAT